MFWVGQEGCGYAKQRRDEGGTNIPLLPHPQLGIVSSNMPLGEGAFSLFVEHRLQYRHFGWIVP